MAGATQQARATSYRGSDDQFPLRVEHIFGETVIRQRPQRVVALGWSAEDSLIDLGLVPVAMPRRQHFVGGVYPWNVDRVGEPKPYLFNDMMIDFEQIAALKPDLIISVTNYITGKDYSRLSEIAPTIARQSPVNAVDWREELRLCGAALGRDSDAKELLSSIVDLFETARTQNMSLAGLRIAFGNYMPRQRGLRIHGASSKHFDIYRRLGMKAAILNGPQGPREMEKEETLIGFEAIPELECDLLALWFPGDQRDEVLGNELLQTLDCVRSGGFVQFSDPALIWAAYAASSRSLQYTLPLIIEKLNGAAARAGLDQ
ncbi:ABC transporter substrate-binding protein [Aliirhizobium smilacinae]|nr:ABC transporter substrate-binding protein [Rhizobium smilacinae]